MHWCSFSVQSFSFWEGTPPCLVSLEDLWKIRPKGKGGREKDRWVTYLQCEHTKLRQNEDDIHIVESGYIKQMDVLDIQDHTALSNGSRRVQEIICRQKGYWPKKIKKAMKSTTHPMSTQCFEFQLHFAVHIEMKAMFARGVLGGQSLLSKCMPCHGNLDWWINLEIWSSRLPNWKDFFFFWLFLKIIFRLISIVWMH